MKIFEGDSLEQVYPQMADYILKNGDNVSPRGQLTKEIPGAAIIINNPKNRVIPSAIRKLNFGFMVGELCWILRGSNLVDEIVHYNSAWKNFSDNGVTLNGAYGQRIFKWDAGLRLNEKGEIYNKTVNQFRRAYDQLVKDKFTRQATISMFDPNKDYEDTKDKPCTNLIRFSIRENKLNMLVVMRSNDLSKGTPYDIFNFTMLQEIMAGLLSEKLGNIEVGKYVHVVDSLHIYESDFNMFKDIVNENYPALYNNSVNYDGRLCSMDEFTKTMKALFEIEEKSRLNQELTMQEACNMIESIDNKVWRSYAAILVTYNFRKYRRSQSELDIIKGYITNEFKSLMDTRYNELPPKTI